MFIILKTSTINGRQRVTRQGLPIADYKSAIILADSLKKSGGVYRVANLKVRKS
tara:strand:+ start:586 stop:747 length:162 start_codon:yes stop_codon:yes gene_type:complete